MKKFFFTLDLEEWYHLEYLKEYRENSKEIKDQKFVPKVIEFLSYMANQHIYFTVFVLGEVALEHPEIVSEISNMGHEIGCHGHEHELVYKLSKEEFYNKIKQSKESIENVIGKKIYGYRAPCFSMEDEKLEVLWELGFKYDASLIKFKEHKLYNVMSLNKFSKVESLIYKNGNKYEFETPTIDIFGKSIPISGGGYFRLFPLSIMKLLIKKHWKNEENFIFYIHPFELTSEKLNITKKIGLKKYFRFQVGRRRLNKKIKKYVTWLKKKNVVFFSCESYFKKEMDEKQ